MAPIPQLHRRLHFEKGKSFNGWMSTQRCRSDSETRLIRAILNAIADAAHTFGVFAARIGMFSWAIKKLQDSRATMLIKETNWAINGSDDRRCAQILILSTLIRKDLSLVVPLFSDITDRPSFYGRDELYSLYCKLEDLLILSKKQRSDIQRMLSSVGEALPSSAQEHAQLHESATKVWMSTVGCEIVPKRREDVVDIWKKLHSSTAVLDEAWMGLLAAESSAMSATAAESSAFSEVDKNTLFADCFYVPSQFTERVRI